MVPRYALSATTAGAGTATLAVLPPFAPDAQCSVAGIVTVVACPGLERFTDPDAGEHQ